MKEFNWKLIPGALGGYWDIRYKNVHITIEPRPHYCDRGRWIAKISATEMWLDEADGWPRYYFDLKRAKLELEAYIERALETLVEKERTIGKSKKVKGGSNV
jgi:hypothetical protein